MPSLAILLLVFSFCGISLHTEALVFVYSLLWAQVFEQSLQEAGSGEAQPAKRNAGPEFQIPRAWCFSCGVTAVNQSRHGCSAREGKAWLPLVPHMCCLSNPTGSFWFCSAETRARS